MNDEDVQKVFCSTQLLQKKKLETTSTKKKKINCQSVCTNSCYVFQNFFFCFFSNQFLPTFSACFFVSLSFFFE